MADVAGEIFSVSGLVESLFGVGKDWSSFITEPIVKRFLKAGDAVLKKETWNDLLEANRLAVEAAADGLGLTVDELRRRPRAAAQEEPDVPCTVIVEEAEEQETARTTDGDEGTVVVDATAESLRNLSTGANVVQDGMVEGPSTLSGEKDVERNISRLWQMMETVLQKNKEQQREIEDVKAKMEVLKAQNKAQGDRIDLLENKLLQK